MIFPIIPLIALIAIIGGGGTLAWYSSLDEEDRDFANELAFELFEKTFEQLGKPERELLRKQYFS